jgi:myo-inositol-1(or 4)-monophosphatase
MKQYSDFEILELICAAEREGAALIMQASDVLAECKTGHKDVVTQYDRRVQELLVERLSSAVESARFFCEENDRQDDLNAEHVFIIDPIDGTMNFIRELGLSAISLALLEKGETVIGVVYNPFSGELFSAERGKGAFLNGEPIKVSDRAELSEALAAVGTSPYYKPKTAECFEIYREFFLRCVDIRRLGSAALDICYVAAGRFDLYYEYILSIWDYAAARLILTEAGGKITNTEGRATASEKKSPIVASNAKLHSAVLDIIKSH